MVSLVREVDELRQQIALDSAVEDTMRRRQRCPACAAQSILHFATVRDHNYGDAFAPMALELRGILSTTPIGEFEIYVCRGCGLVEWYVKGAGEIDPAKLDKHNRASVTLIEHEPPAPGGVYR